ncbi:MAG: 4-hydroxybenzoate octaprenyltransferase [Gammaproteobacteria bacterium]|nr:4-hydroxybenzoate octaprenyltransferase [Gammaproteobacteria bacterium]
MRKKTNAQLDLWTRIARWCYRKAPLLFTKVPDIYRDKVPAHVRRPLNAYGQLMRIDRPIGVYLLLWPTLWALLLASDGAPNLSLIVIFTLGTFLMRSAGCVINDIADRNFDGKVKRTKNRPLARGTASVQEALGLFIALSLCAFALVLTLNLFTVALSFGAILIASIYPFMKRHTYFPQVILGAAFAWSIPMAYGAVEGEVPIEAWLMYLSTLMWVLAYDTFYGMVDRKDDLKLGIKSTAILFGDADLPIIAVIQTFFIFGMLLLGVRLELTWPYYVGLLCAVCLMAYQFWITRKRNPEQCFKAFLNNNYVGLIILLGMIGHYATR